MLAKDGQYLTIKAENGLEYKVKVKETCLKERDSVYIHFDYARNKITGLTGIVELLNDGVWEESGSFEYLNCGLEETPELEEPAWFQHIEE